MNKANLESQQASNAAHQASAEGGQALGHAGESIKQEAKSLADRASVAGHRTHTYVSNRAGQMQSAAKNAASDLRSGVDTFSGQVSASYEAGRGTQPSPTLFPSNASFGQRVAGAIKVPFTSSAFVAGHATSNPTHTVRESGVPYGPGLWGKVGVAAAGAWLGALTLAGAAPKYLGFLVKPAPATAGIASIPNLAAYAVYGSAALAGALLLTRVAVAVYDKVQDARGNNAAAAAAATAPAEATSSSDKGKAPFQVAA